MNVLRISMYSMRGLILGGSVLFAAPGWAATTVDSQGNVGYDTAAECDAAVLAGSARFYRPHTNHEPLKRAGEVSVKGGKLSDLASAREAAGALGYDVGGYARGACDLGVGRSGERDGVTAQLVGKYVPFAPDFPINIYMGEKDAIVRATMQQCDNHFGKNLPRPVNLPTTTAVAPPSECFANVVIPARFETKTTQVVKVAASKRMELVPATYKTVTEQVLVSPEYTRQIPVPATYKTITEQVVVQPESYREEPIPAVYKNVTEKVLVKPESKRYEVVPATFKAVTEQVEVRAASKRLEVIPATYKTVTETVEVRPASKRIEIVPATYKTESQEVLAKPESVRLDVMQIPYKTVTERVETRAAAARLEVVPGTSKDVDERVLVRAASKRIEVVPATFETVIEQIRVADETTEWKRGRNWLSQARAITTSTEYAAARAAGQNPTGKPVSTALANSAAIDDDVMCLVAIPAQYKTITKSVMTSPATTREVEIPAEYAIVKRQVVGTEADVRKFAIPAEYGMVTREVIDFDAILARGFKLSDDGRTLVGAKGDVWTPVFGRGADGKPNAGTGNGANSADPRIAGSNVVGYSREVRTPAEYRTVTREVIDQAPTTREILIPAESRTVTRQVVDAAATTREIVIPAEFRTVTRQVVDTPATTREIPIPAVYQTVERRVIETPGSTRRIPIPAVVKTVERRVIDKPATTRPEVVPAVYKAETRRVIDQDATMREIAVPAQFETLSYQEKVADATTVRRAILCETNATPAKIKEVQAALLKAGFDPGRVSGTFHAQTLKAINAYQQAKGLPVDQFLNLDTVKSLGVAPY